MSKTSAPIVQDQFRRALPMVRTGKEKSPEMASTNKIPGGLADGKPLSKYDPEQMAMGIKVEREHTDDPDIAKEIASDHLEEISDYYTRLKKMEDEAEKPKKMREANAADGKTTGNRTGVGFFIPLPENLAQQYPSRAPEDRSPSHVTLLYVGEVPAAREKQFLRVVTLVLSKEPGPIKAQLGQLDYFRQPEKGQTVAIQSVKFSRDVGEIKDRLWSALEDAGFRVEDSFPGAYRSHTTLAYLDGADAVYKGDIPAGSWEFNSIPIWGLPTNHDIPLGSWVNPVPGYLSTNLEDTWGPVIYKEAMGWKRNKNFDDFEYNRPAAKAYAQYIYALEAGDKVMEQKAKAVLEDLEFNQWGVHITTWTMARGFYLDICRRMKHTPDSGRV